MATIRVSEDIYKELNRVAGELRQESGHPVSMDDVLEHLLKTRGLRLSDFAGSWKMTDEEVEDFAKGLKGFWSRWKYPRE
jgi:predicted CopG family antitoxin